MVFLDWQWEGSIVFWTLFFFTGNCFVNNYKYSYKPGIFLLCDCQSHHLSVSRPVFLSVSRSQTPIPSPHFPLSLSVSLSLSLSLKINKQCFCWHLEVVRCGLSLCPSLYECLFVLPLYLNVYNFLKRIFEFFFLFCFFLVRFDTLVKCIQATFSNLQRKISRSAKLSFFGLLEEDILMFEMVLFGYCQKGRRWSENDSGRGISNIL